MKLFSPTRILLLLLTVCLSAVQAMAGTFNGGIKGTVLTSDGKSAEGVIILLKGTKKSAITDANGLFQLRNIPAGDYELVVTLIGYAPEIQRVTVADDQTTGISIALSVSNQQLKEVEITSRRNKFGKKESAYVARMQLSNLENPQSYAVISKELIGDQVAVEFKDAMKNAPGLLANTSPAGTISGYIRGFSLSNYARNGMASQNWTQVDLINVERLEVIKGPSSTLFGTAAGYFGGLLNVVTKKPYDHLGGEITANLGSWGLGRLTADINSPLNEDKSVLLRVNAAVHNENSFMDYGHSRSMTFAPSLSYQVNEKLKVSIEAEIYKGDRTQQPYPTFNLAAGGVTFRSLADLPIDYKKSLGGEDVDGKQYANNYYAQAEYTINDNWTSTSNLTYSQNRVENSNQIYPTWVNDSIINRSISNFGPRTFTSMQFQQNFNGKFSIGGLQNNLLAGIDLFYYDAKQRYTSVAYDQINLKRGFLPMSKPKIDALLGAATPITAAATNSSYSAYLSDVLNLTDRLSVLASVRLDRFENQASTQNGVKGTDKTGQTALSPKFGIVYQVLKNQLSVFANYMNSFANQTPRPQVDGTMTNFDPTRANQWEGGVKMELLDSRLNATLSYYNIDVEDVVYQNDDKLIVQNGSQRSKGFEAEISASPITGLNLVAGYAYNDNKMRKTTAAQEGKTAVASPENMVNYWVSYKLPGTALKGFGVGFGGNYVSKCYFNIANTFEIPAYNVINATIYYDQPKWRLGLKVNNITSEEYWNISAYAQAPAQLVGNVTFKF